ncbi:MAG: methylmalonyl Co-A mutase-associated GTPase MeaB [Paracoccaceae bacterium]
MTELLKKIIENDRKALAKAITLVESTLSKHKKESDKLIQDLIKINKNESIRIALSGTPGAGKSTFIEAFGSKLIEDGNRVAVLAIDPSSKQTGGSILGDKTRMENLSRQPNAFIRPSPSSLNLGGVTTKTREVIQLCEAGGYNIIIVETVGVGQSETAVFDMTDVFCLLITPDSGDELQGLKKGITESADFIIVNKADGKLTKSASLAVAEYTSALRLLGKKNDVPENYPKATMVSSLTGKGIKEINDEILNFISLQKKNGHFERKRSQQKIQWFKEKIDFEIFDFISKRNNFVDIKNTLQKKIEKEEISVPEAIINFTNILKNKYNNE